MNYVIGTAGHVDHGKSTLVQALTGIDPDRLAEEKAREMTIDLGFAWLTLPDGSPVGVVDVPGHRDFIENMLAGVGGIDLALLIIAADEGVMPQTREHLAILDLLELRSAVVALTKIDLITDPDWIDLVSLDIIDLLAGTALAGSPIVPVSARTGAGLDHLVQVMAGALTRQPPRPDRGRPRLSVDRVFTMSGFGTVVTGTLLDGSLQVGDEVEVLPRSLRARIRGLQSHRQKLENARPGSRVAVNLTGLSTEDLRRGDLLARPGLLRPSTLIDVRFRHLPDAPRPFLHNTEVKFFSGAAEVSAVARLLGDEELAPGAQGWLQLRLAEPLALDKGDRYILRVPSPGETVGGGLVIDPHPPHRWRRFRADVLDRLATLASGSPAELLREALEAQQAVSVDHLPAISGLAAEDLPSALLALRNSGELFDLPDGQLMARASWDRLLTRIIAQIDVFHRANPLRGGIPRESLRAQSGAEPKLFSLALGNLIESGQLSERDNLVMRAGWRVRFTAKQEAAVQKLRQQIDADPVNTPSVKEAAAIVGDEVLTALFEQNELKRVSGEVFFDAQTYARLREQVYRAIEKQGPVSVAQLRDLLRSSRKYVLALLEHFDEIGLTRREGDFRTWNG